MARRDRGLIERMGQFFPKFNVSYLLRGIVYWDRLNCVRDQTARFAEVNGRWLQAMVRSTRIAGGGLSFVSCSSDGGQRQDSPWCRWRANRLTGSRFSVILFITLLPFSSFRSAFRLAGAVLEIDPTSMRHAP
jgi:hypothetical protein